MLKLRNTKRLAATGRDVWPRTDFTSFFFTSLGIFMLLPTYAIRVSTTLVDGREFNSKMCLAIVWNFHIFHM